MDPSVSGKDEIWFLRVCHHVPQRAITNTLPVGDLVTEEHITDRQFIGYNISQAVVYSLMLLKMGEMVARNVSS